MKILIEICFLDCFTRELTIKWMKKTQNLSKLAKSILFKKTHRSCRLYSADNHWMAKILSIWIPKILKFLSKYWRIVCLFHWQFSFNLTWETHFHQYFHEWHPMFKKRKSTWTKCPTPKLERLSLINFINLFFNVCDWCLFESTSSQC